jgi:hypothetical protein
VEYVVTATNGGPATSDKANFSGYTADGIPETPNLRSVSTPSENYSANASFSLGDSRSRGYDKVNWRTSSGRSGSWGCSGGCSGGTATDLGTSQQTMEIQACNVAGRCSPWSNGVTFHPYGPTKSIRNPGENHDNNSITFTWNAPDNNGRPITQYQVTGDKDETFGASRESTTIGGLGYSESRTIRVRAFATDSGWGPYTSITGRTNPAPAQKVVSVYKGPSCGPSNCPKPDGTQCGTNCNFVGYELENYTGNIVCSLDSSDGAWGTLDDGNSGRHNPTNGSNFSGKFFGFPTGWVSVRCTGSNGSDSATRNPWG